MRPNSNYIVIPAQAGTQLVERRPVTAERQHDVRLRLNLGPSLRWDDDVFGGID